MLCQGMPQRWQHELGMGYTLTVFCMRRACVQITVASASLSSLNETVVGNAQAFRHFEVAFCGFFARCIATAVAMRRFHVSLAVQHDAPSGASGCLLKPSRVVTCNDICCCSGGSANQLEDQG